MCVDCYKSDITIINKPGYLPTVLSEMPNYVIVVGFTI